MLDWRALAGESATEEGPQEGVQGRRHPIDRYRDRGASAGWDHVSSWRGPTRPRRRCRRSSGSLEVTGAVRSGVSAGRRGDGAMVHTDGAASGQWQQRTERGERERWRAWTWARAGRNNAEAALFGCRRG